MRQVEQHTTVEEFLAGAENYPHPVKGRVEIRETHISRVFLAGDFAYKQKKTVSFGFVDYSTPERRLHFCNEEVRLNRRLAPDLYVEVLAIAKDDARMYFTSPDDAGPDALDYVVKMRRVDPRDLLSERLDDGRVSTEDIDRLVHTLVDFYAKVERGGKTDKFASPAAIRQNLDGNFEHSWRAANEYLSIPKFQAIRSKQLSFLELRHDLFERRVDGGHICEGHGDLRSDHIAFLPDPVVIDCVEFSDQLRSGDIASDLSFLYMDLEFRGHVDIAHQHVFGDFELERVRRHA